MSSANKSLSSATEERKARLAQLKSLKRKQPSGEVATPESDRLPQEPDEKADIAKLHLSGRNYDAETRGPKLGFEAPPIIGLEKQTLEEQAADIEADIRQRAQEDARDDKGIDLFQLQPKKPNWDLKRNLEAKLETLNVRTDNAIARLVRDRIVAAQKSENGSDQGSKTDEDGGSGINGIALVEGLRVREKEEEEERRELEEADAA